MASSYRQTKRGLSGNNPRNPFSALYKALTRFMSGPIDTWRTQTPRQLKRWQLEKYRSRFRSGQGQFFKQSAYNPFEHLYLRSIAYQNRAERYIDFDQMEFCPEIGSALDIYADEMTVSSPLTPMIHIHSPNQEIKDIIENLLYDTLNIEHNLFGWCRTTCKYGDFFLYLDIDEKFGITHVMGLPADEVERLEGEDPTNPNYVQFQWNSAGLTLENWQVAHFRILGNDKYTPYGTSILDPVRRIFRQLDLVEQHMMAYRVVRSAERRVFYLDIAGISPEKVEEYLEGQITQYKRRQVTDDEEGRIDLRYKPEAVDMDFFIPVRGQNSATRVDTLKGGEFTGAIDDVKYLRDKLFTGLKIPQEYLTNYASDGGGDTDKATLAQKDIRFARTIGRLQKSIVSELEKICITHLFIIGYRGQDLTNFRLELNSPSKIAELQELEQWRTKFEVAGQATEGFFSRRWLGKNLFGMTDEEILQNQRELFYDRKMDALLEATIETTELEAGGGGAFNIGDDEEPEVGAETDEEPEDEGPLLAAPGHRREGTTTAKSKGKIYHPVKTDKRSMGARRRSYLKQSGDSKAERGKRNVFPGKSSLDTLANGLFEKMENEFLSPSYEKEEETNLLEQNFEAKMLVESLERINKPKENKVLVLENKEEDEEK